MNPNHPTLVSRANFRYWRLAMFFCLAAVFHAPHHGQTASDVNEAQGSEARHDQSKKSAKPSANKASDETTDGFDEAKAKKSSLTIVVTGGEKPSGQAEVRVTPVAQSGNKKIARITRFTNSQGRVVFSALSVGEVEIVVLAKGWETKRERLTLREGKNLLELELSPR